MAKTRPSLSEDIPISNILRRLTLSCFSTCFSEAEWTSTSFSSKDSSNVATSKDNNKSKILASHFFFNTACLFFYLSQYSDHQSHQYSKDHPKFLLEGEVTIICMRNRQCSKSLTSLTTSIGRIWRIRDLRRSLISRHRLFGLKMWEGTAGRLNKEQKN